MLYPCSNPACLDRLHPTQKVRVLGPILWLILGFAVLEWVIGRLSHSLALQADSGHTLADAIAILIALGATAMTRLTHRFAPSRSPRWELGAAIVNAIGLVLMAGLMAWEACKHLYHPPTIVISLPMLLTAIVGLLINGIGLWRLHPGSQQDLNLRGVFLHTLADLASSIGVIMAAIAILFLNWVWLDGIIGLAIAGLVGSSGLWLVRQSWVQWQQFPRTVTAALPAMGWQEIGKTDLASVLRRSSAL
ncbi:cation diffusion facilitator family transporter [Trichothermofontia sichuanensis B231]|uniref:cation diffusion facilitator family transporter n=1 Tax=Trichothermofontia sichuanensis TaxID=3045816 RepID=UPI0022478B76|nr:cation diffusion facilitator family transporter [Trichothermofontia sichuanensis]UZQ54356.1 cation diffusion facilitator family transporter [Trichothermofontia sichuanensis B231]